MARQKHFRLPDDVLEMINNRDKEIYPTENVYITESVRNFFKKEETENVMDELEDIQDKLNRIEKKLEEDAGKKYSSFSSDAEKKELYGKPDFLKYYRMDWIKQIIECKKGNWESPGSLGQKIKKI